MLRNQLKGREAKLKRKRVTETCGSLWQRLVETCDTDLWEVETDDWLKVLQFTQLESSALFLWYNFRCSQSKSRDSWNFNVSHALYVCLWMDQVLSKKGWCALGEDRVVTHRITGWPKGWPRQRLWWPSYLTQAGVENQASELIAVSVNHQAAGQHRLKVKVLE